MIITDLTPDQDELATDIVEPSGLGGCLGLLAALGFRALGFWGLGFRV